jgi:hypothetical protein
VRRPPGRRAAKGGAGHKSPACGPSATVAAGPSHWDDCQANRDRDAIYGYLAAVYDLVAWWMAEGRDIGRARRALRLQRFELSEREDPFAAIIRCTADPAKADKRTRSKWSRAMRYAATYKPESEPLGQFIQLKGGINTCAGGFSRHLGRGTRLQGRSA